MMGPEANHDSDLHFHKDENGFFVRCYHKSKSVLSDASFWIGVTISFPIEHFIWTKVPILSHIAEYVGLIGGH